MTEPHWYDRHNTERFSAMGIPCFACTPDLFPDLMAHALGKKDIAGWAATQNINLIRGQSS